MSLLDSMLSHLRLLTIGQIRDTILEADVANGDEDDLTRAFVELGIRPDQVHPAIVPLAQDMARHKERVRDAA